MPTQDWRHQPGPSCRRLVGGVAQGEPQPPAQDTPASAECFPHSPSYGLHSDSTRQRPPTDQETEAGEVTAGPRPPREGVVEWAWVHHATSLRGPPVGTGTTDRTQLSGCSGQDRSESKFCQKKRGGGQGWCGNREQPSERVDGRRGPGSGWLTGTKAGHQQGAHLQAEAARALHATQVWETLGHRRRQAVTRLPRAANVT